MAVDVDEILALPEAERRAIAEAIIASLSEPALTPAEERLIDQRLAAIDRDPDADVPWEQVRDRILGG